MPVDALVGRASGVELVDALVGRASGVELVDALVGRASGVELVDARLAPLTEPGAPLTRGVLRVRDVWRP